MIFSAFIKKKWAHKNPHVRINAIQEILSTNDPEHKKTLLSLAESDDNELVRRAALTQLADFSVLVTQSTQNSNDHIKAFCTKQIDDILSNNHEVKASTEEKLAYLSQLTHKSRLEEWLHQETDESLIIALYEKLAKPQLLLALFARKLTPNIQTYLIKQADTIELLEKMLKKSQLESSSELILQKLERLQAQIEKPIKLRKKVQLVLSKLLSLKDISNYEEVLTKQQNLTLEWNECLNEFSVLGDDEIQTFTQKYDQITHQINQLFQVKAEQYQQALIAQKLKDEREAAQIEFNNTLTELHKELTRCIFETECIDESVYLQKLSVISQGIHDSVLGESEKTALLNQVEKQSHILESLPAIALSITEATHLISRISQLVLPTSLDNLNERYATYQAWKDAWKAVMKNSNGILPASILSSHDEIAQQWKSGLAPLLAEQKSAFNQAKKKIKEFNRLILAGKFKPSFYVYKKYIALYHVLSPKQQALLQREHDEIEKKHAELVDWEHYISTPRKQTLLDEINKIVETPLDSPNEQAKTVKELRKKWNALGHADEALEQELNYAFNLACEAAFEPCRLFYKEQEALRANHLAQRESLLTSIQETCANLCLQKEQGTLDWKTLDAQVKALEKSWRSAGEVDREHYKALNAQFKEIIKPVVRLINDYHENNKEQKEALIASAEKCLAIDNISSAVNEVKTLQQAWKDIGFCGSHHENKLWQAFRKVNDKVFAKRDQKQREDKALQSNMLAEFDAEVTTLKEALKNTSEVEALQNLKIQIQEVLSRANQHKPPLKRINTALLKIDAQVSQALERLRVVSAKQEMTTVFNLLTECAEQNVTLDTLTEHNLYLELSVKWQKMFKKLMELKNISSREDKTLALEIFANIDSPQALQAQRLSLQVQLLQDSLVNGESINLDGLLKEWVLLGKLTVNDLPLLKRIMPIYC